jgi:hypothetical protein
MKASRREIHEQKCPDRFNCPIKYKRCPYDPLELIEEKNYEKHLLECKSRPRITVEEQQAIERAKELNDIATEKEQIRYAREKYYKGCVEEPDIPGMSKKSKKNNQKKQSEKLKKKFAPVIKKEEDQFVALADKEQDSADDESHNIDNFAGDKYFDLGNKVEEKEKVEENKNPNSGSSTKTDDKKSEKKNDSSNNQKDSSNNKNENKNNKKDGKNNKKDEDKKKQNNQNEEKMFYDPNDEDKDVGKYSANVIVPDEIYHILHGNY